MNKQEAKDTGFAHYDEPFVVFQEYSGEWDVLPLAKYHEAALGQPVPLDLAIQEDEAEVFNDPVIDKS